MHVGNIVGTLSLMQTIGLNTWWWPFMRAQQFQAEDHAQHACCARSWNTKNSWPASGSTFSPTKTWNGLVSKTPDDDPACPPKANSMPYTSTELCVIGRPQTLRQLLQEARLYTFRYTFSRRFKKLLRRKVYEESGEVRGKGLLADLCRCKSCSSVTWRAMSSLDARPGILVSVAKLDFVDVCCSTRFKSLGPPFSLSDFGPSSLAQQHHPQGTCLSF